jgi:uncharacterized YigZ family protein
MHLPFDIITISKKTEFRIKEKGSQFLAEAIPIENGNDANAKILSTRKAYYDATHHCYAYKLANGSYKFTDDGEPNGTAGIRILNAINHENVVDILVIVTRYYGGTKLGAGPLGNAYYNSALEVIKISERVNKKLFVKSLLSYGYEFSNLVHRTIANFHVQIEKNIFNEIPQIKCLIPAEKCKDFARELTNQSQNKVNVEIKDQFVYISQNN